MVVFYVYLFKISNESQADNDYMEGTVFPGIEKLARELQPDENFRLMRAGKEGKLELTNQQIAQILANCFFCNFQINIDFPHVVFDKFEKLILTAYQCEIYLTFKGSTAHTGVKFNCANLEGKSSSVFSLTSKLSPQVHFCYEYIMLIIYTHKITFLAPSSNNGSVTIERVCVGEGIFNRDSLNTPLPEISIVESGNLLDCPTNVTHVELSNRSN